MTDWEQAQRPSRAAWRDRYGVRSYLDREQATRDRLARIREEYREQLKDDCAHGARRRRVGVNGGEYWAALVCPADDPKCGLKYVSPAQVFQEWAAGGA